MARTWTLVTTLSNSVKKSPYFVTGNDTLFFINTGGQTVISWDGVTETDISGSTWSGDDEVKDLCYFDGTLYAAVNTYDGGGGYGCGIYSYDGVGQSWTLEQTLQISGNDCLFNDALNDAKFLVADSNRMLTVVSSGSSSDKIFASTDGSTWTLQTVNSSATYRVQNYLLGTLFTELTEITAIVLISGEYRAIQYDTGVNWSLVGADTGQQYAILVGYADGKSFFANGIDEELQFSTDWGAIRTATSLTASGDGANQGQPLVWYLADDAIMSLDENGDPTAFVWDSGTNDFVADGDTSTDDINGFFAINGTLYGISAGNKIYSGGSLNGGSSGLRLLGLATDQVNVYVTGAETGTLFLEVYDLATLSLARRVEFGTATFAELDSRTRGLWPVVRPGTDGIVYLYGRDGNDVKVQVSDDAGYTFTDLDDGGWASDKFCVGLLIDPLEPTDVVSVFADDDIYRSRLSGATWSKVDDGPVTLRAAARHPVDELDLILAGQGSGSGELFFSPNLGVTSEDVSEATMGQVNVVEVGR